MKKMFVISVVVCMLLTACNAQRSIPTTFPSPTPKPSFTATAIVISSLTSTPTKIQPTEPPSTPTGIQPTEVPSTPTFTPFPPYHNKKVVFEYYIVGSLSYFDTFFAKGYSDYPKLILYDDGQILANGGQKVLSAEEMNRFLSKLETLGFYSIESNQHRDNTDKLYDFGNNYQQVFDGLKYCVLVNADTSRQLCAREGYMQYLIPKMKAIFKYLDEYKPAGLTPYYPDRILLSMRPADPSRDDLAATATPWDNRFPSLDFPPPRTYSDETPPSIKYIEGDMAKEIYIFIKNSHSHDVFIQDGKKYIVEVDAVLPHETVKNDYQ